MYGGVEQEPPLRQCRSGVVQTNAGAPMPEVMHDPRQSLHYYSRMRSRTAICLCLSGLLAISAQSIASASAAPTRNTRALWTLQKSPSPSGKGDFHDVDCTGAQACTSVGSYYNESAQAEIPLAASWNGRAWRLQPTQVPAGTDHSYLDGVSCAKRTSCAAVGTALTSDRSITLAEVWRGKRWKVTPTPPLEPLSSSSLMAVSCPSPTDCTAVGSTDDQALIEHWNGATWTIQRVPRPAGSTSSLLYGVSCVTRKWCMAAGYYDGAVAFTEIWTGKHWSIRPAEQIPGSGSQFTGVSCTSRVSCTAVGIYGNLSSVNDPLAERWNGKVWAIQPVPHPEGQPDSFLIAVSCATVHACAATGQYFTRTGPSYTFAASWNGKTWVLQRTVNPSETINILTGVACTSATACTAVGMYAGEESTTTSLIERYSAGRCDQAGSGDSRFTWLSRRVPIPRTGPRSNPAPLA